MLIDRIKRHNDINGLLFSAVEFAGVAAILTGFAIYGAVLGKYLLAASLVAIAANCLPVVYFALRSLKKGEKDIGIMAMFSGKGRTEISTKYPQSGMDTIVIVTATLIPGLALLLVCLDVMRQLNAKS
jgi:hypothetical protein